MSFARPVRWHPSHPFADRQLNTLVTDGNRTGGRVVPIDRDGCIAVWPSGGEERGEEGLYGRSLTSEGQMTSHDFD
ncbi:MAG: hypothetical protein ACFBSD_12730 [Paracoccaceae bacterium]